MFHEEEDPNDVYELLQLLGEGSYGSVYKGVNRKDKSTAAVKIVNCGNKSSVTGEIDFLRKLKCDYVVAYIDGYLFDGELWILMEFCAGGSLSDLRDITKRNLIESEVRAVTASAMLGLEHLHSLHNIHRDIKAGNILLTADGKAKLADFGVSAQLTNSKDMRKTMIGTPFWMAPELIQETKYNGKADIWSMGITILELVEGRPPHFNVHPMRAIFMIPMKPAPKLENSSAWSLSMNDFVERCLVKEVDDRWSAKDLLEHDWIAHDVEITRQNIGLDVLRRLVADNWDVIEASRVNENTEEDDLGDDGDGTDSDKTAGPGDADRQSTMPAGRSEEKSSASNTSYLGTSKSTMSRSKSARPYSKRIKSHATASGHSKSTTGEARNTSSSQSFGRVNSQKYSSDDTNSTLKVVKQRPAGKYNQDDGEGTMRANNNGETLKTTMKSARFDNESYFKKDANNTTNPALVYDLLLLLGEGSYGRVFKAMHKFEHVEVAIKIIPCDSQSDVNSEIQFLRRLNCPYIVSFVDGFLYDEEVWIVMEYCGAGSLSDIREVTKQNLTEPQLKLVVSYCVMGLKHLHSLMSIHRDIKAGNILLTADGVAKLADFGVSAQMQSATQKRRTVIGTPFWMAPEVIQETSYDSKADIWSLGITILELAEGRPPHFEVHPMRAIFLIPIKPAPQIKDPSAWSTEMVDFLSRCLVKEAEARLPAEKLLAHPWIEQLSIDVENSRQPDDLRVLADVNLAAVYRARESRRGSRVLNRGAHRLDDVDDVDVDVRDDRSTDTMQLKEGSRETSIGGDESESTIDAKETGGYDSDATDDNNLVKEDRQTFNVDSVKKSHVPTDGGDTWFTVDSLRKSIVISQASNTWQHFSNTTEDSEDERQYTLRSHGTLKINQDKNPSSTADSDDTVSLSSGKKEILRQLAALDQKYKADKEKLRMRYEMDKNKLKLSLASIE